MHKAGQHPGTQHAAQLHHSFGILDTPGARHPGPGSCDETQHDKLAQPYWSAFGPLVPRRYIMGQSLLLPSHPHLIPHTGMPVSSTQHAQLRFVIHLRYAKRGQSTYVCTLSPSLAHVRRCSSKTVPISRDAVLDGLSLPCYIYEGGGKISYWLNKSVRLRAVAPEARWPLQDFYHSTVWCVHLDHGSREFRQKQRPVLFSAPCFSTARQAFRWLTGVFSLRPPT